MEPVEIDVSAHSSATPNIVYEVAKNSEGYPRWSRIGSFKHVRDGALERYGVGSQRIYRTWPLTLLEEVVELVPNRSVGYVLLSGLPFRGYCANIDLSPAPGGGTAIRWHNHFYTTAPGTRWCFKWFMQMVLDEMVPQLAREAERIEKALQSASNLS